jgi:tetratricopeptide (TPR) repeat protein
VALVLIFAGVLNGENLSTIYSTNSGHVALLKAYFAHDAQGQAKMVTQSLGDLSRLENSGNEDVDYWRAQIALAPIAGCPPQQSGTPPGKPGGLSEGRARQLAQWIETNSIIPLCLRAGNLDNAVAYYTWVTVRYPVVLPYLKSLPSQLVSAFVERAYSNYDAGNDANARSDWAAAHTLTRNSAYEAFGDLAEKAALDHRSAQQYLLARDVASEPENSPARIYLAQAYNATAAGKEALEAILPLVAAKSADTRVWQQYGQALIGLKRLDEAEAALKRAVELAPEDLGALNRMGVYYLARRRAADAEPWFRKALGLPGGTKDYWLWEHLGDTLLAQGRTPEAVDAFRQAVGAAPGDLSASARAKLEKAQGKQ